MPREYVVTVCKFFRKRLEAVITANRSIMELNMCNT
jgi:hypothetical protein